MASMELATFLNRLALGIADVDTTGQLTWDLDPIPAETPTPAIPEFVDDGNSGSTKTISRHAGVVHQLTLTDSCVLTFTNLDPGERLVLILIQGGTGSFTIIWPANLAWSDGTPPTLSTTPGSVDIVTVLQGATDTYGAFAPNFYYVT